MKAEFNMTSTAPSTENTSDEEFEEITLMEPQNDQVLLRIDSSDLKKENTRDELPESDTSEHFGTLSTLGAGASTVASLDSSAPSLNADNQKDASPSETDETHSDSDSDDEMNKEMEKLREKLKEMEEKKSKKQSIKLAKAKERTENGQNSNEIVGRKCNGNTNANGSSDDNCDILQAPLPNQQSDKKSPQKEDKDEENSVVVECVQEEGSSDHVVSPKPDKEDVDPPNESRKETTKLLQAQLQKQQEKQSEQNAIKEQLREELKKLKQQEEEGDQEIMLLQTKLKQQTQRTKFKKTQSCLREKVLKKTDVEIVFLLDCTGSMDPYINEAKEAIQTIIAEIKRRYGSKFFLGFVGYRDHCDGEKRIESLPFTSSVEEFKEFVGNIEAKGGGDPCEDVFGGLEASINLVHQEDGKSWKNANRCLIHIADCPCHGSRFHELSRRDDHYYDSNEMDTRGLTIERLVADLKNKNIKYYFAKIKDFTDKMIKEFQMVGGDDFVTMVKLSNVKDLCKIAITSITNTIAETASAIITRDTVLNTFCENHFRLVQDELEPIRIPFHIQKNEPTNDLEWETINAKIYSYAVTIKKEVLKVKKDKCKDRQLVKVKNPFSKGSQRIAYYCIENGRPKFPFFEAHTKRSNCVLKKFQYDREGHDDLSEYESMVKCQTISKYCAEKFNEVKPNDFSSIHFIEVRLVQVDKPNKSSSYFTIEDIFSSTDEFIKYNNNAGYVNLKTDTLLQTFSHWTYDYTRGYLMVTDLQGIQSNEKFILTDPCVHCDSPYFGITNLGTLGMEQFFRSHTCSEYCKKMKLSKNKFTVLD